MFKIINAKNTDHHIHSCTFSDGINTIEEIVEYAGKMKLKEITISDHSQAELEFSKKRYGVCQSTCRYTVNSYQNIKNNVKVNFSVEADLLDAKGNVCFDIQGQKSEKFILSAHQGIYLGKDKQLNEAYEKAILKYKDKITCIGHPCLDHNYYPDLHFAPLETYLDIDRLTEFTNKHKIPLEVNGKSLIKKCENEKLLKQMLEKAKLIMINSDAHNLWGLKYPIPFAYKWLKENSFL